MTNWCARGRKAAKLLSAALISFSVAPSAAFALSVQSSPSSSFMPVGEPTSVPFGWADFCRRYKGVCDGGPLDPVDVVAASATMKEVDRVNKWVNSRIVALTDKEHWGVLDQWDYPSDSKGDCEDFALLKRKILLEEGFPRQALLMTVVKDASNEGHAVLTVKTSAGDFVLDNLSPEVKPWRRTPYRFVKRQSQVDQNVWVQIGDPTPEPDYVSR